MNLKNTNGVVLVKNTAKPIPILATCLKFLEMTIKYVLLFKGGDEAY